MPWWLSGLMCESMCRPMLKVKVSNPGITNLKFGLFQFSKWLCLDKNNNLGILVVLLVASWLINGPWLCSSHLNTVKTPRITTLRRKSRQLHLRVSWGQSFSWMLYKTEEYHLNKKRCSSVCG